MYWGENCCAKKSIMKVFIRDTFLDNGVVQGDGGAIKLDKGSNNGDYKCDELACDSKHFKATIRASTFGNNYAGKAKEFSDVNGNTELEDDVTAWRHVSNFNRQCNAACCATGNAQSTCVLAPGETSKCRSMPTALMV